MNNKQQMVLGGYNPMTVEQLNDQVLNINKILNYFDINTYYSILYGECQVVAGMNYKIELKQHKKCSKHKNHVDCYLLEYYVDLSGRISGSLHKLSGAIDKPALCIVRFVC